MKNKRRVSVAPACPKRGRPPVPLERITACALELLDSEGIEALSMRTVAERIESGTAVLYRRVGNRARLIALVVDLVFGEIEFDAGKLAAMTWQRASREMAEATFDVLRRHPHVPSLLVEQVPVGPNALRLREHGLRILLAAGFSPGDAARFHATLARYVVGLAIQAKPGAIGDRDLAKTVRELPPAAFPATLATAASMPIPLADEFGFGLDLLIVGAQARMRSRKRSKR